MLKLGHQDRRRYAIEAAGVMAVAMIALASCTSDEPGLIGAGIPSELDLADPTVVKVHTLTDTGSLTLTDPDKPFAASEVLYFGRQGGDASSILARYDFSSLQDSVGAGVEINEANIQKVTLRLFRLKAYETDEKAVATAEKSFEVWTLADTLDTSLYPGEEPVTAALIADELAVGAAIFIELPETQFVDWWQNGHTGIMIREGASSDPGLIGYASTDLELFTQLDLEDDETVVGPTITVTFEDDLEVTGQTFAPIADVSTFHELEQPGNEFGAGFMVRTHLRAYPWLRFDLGGLPPHIRVNRAVLRCAVDTTLGYGPLAALVLSAVPLAEVSGRDSLPLDDLGDIAQTVAGQVNVDPRYIAEATAPWLGWDVTSTIQRHINGALDSDTALLLSDGEDVFASYDVALWDPDFYLTRFQIFGTDPPEPGAVDLRPYLEITYSPFTGGVQ